MQARKTLVELAKEVEYQKSIKRDYIVPSQKMNMNFAGRLGFGEYHYELGKVADSQLATKLGIPQPYYDKMKAADTELLAHNVNVWLAKENDKKMIRVLGNTARAILSDRYRPLDNDMVLEAVLPILMEHSGLQVLSAEITERRLYLQVVSPRLEGEVKKGDIVQQGLTISNSEVGLGAVNVDPMLYILSCLNGAIMATAMKKYHIGKRVEADGYGFFRAETIAMDNKAFLMKIEDTVRQSFDELSFRDTLQRVTIAANNKIQTEIPDVIEDVTKRFTLTKTEGNSVLMNFINGGDLSQWGLSNAVTAIANTLDDYDRAIELQRIGGKIIDLTPTEWAMVAH